MGERLRCTVLMLTLGALATGAPAQGVPVFDSGLAIRREAILEQERRDLELQGDRLGREEELEEIEREQLDALGDILDATTAAGGRVPGLVEDLEAGSGPAAEDGSAADALYAPDDPNPAADQLFGDASNDVEGLIIRVSKETHGLPGVGRAGLSVVQWRSLLQALIWQESRFTTGARSPVGAFGLTQIMPGTASDLGINPAYYDSPYLQVEGGARYLAQMLAMFDGNIIHALAAYNAGPGNVQKHGGVPPFAETQNYVVVIPERYNMYLARIGGIDALGTIEPSLLANASMSLNGHGASVYGDYSLISVKAAAGRVRSIIERIGETADVHEAMALNTYARAELARLVAIRTRLKAARTQPLSAAQLAQAAARAEEDRFMNFALEELQ